MTTPVRRSTVKIELRLGSRPSGHIKEGDMIQDVKAIIWKLETLNKKHYIKHLIIMVHEGQKVQ